MKKSSILLMMTLVAASCANDNDFSESLFANGEGYVKFAIQLPARTALKSNANDQYDDGTVNEYAVNDATLVLFEGADESSAVISSAYNLNLSFNTEGTATDNITSTAKVVQKIDDALGSGNKFYALVILNNNGLFTISGTSLKFGEVDCTGKTLIQFNSDTKLTLSSEKHILNGAGASASQFLMTNAPLFTAQGGTVDPASGKVKILSEIDPTKIYPTEALAASNPATDVYVERAASKVTLSVGDGVTKTTKDELDFEVLGWQLDNTNTETYVLRNVSDFGNWKSLYSNATTLLGDQYRFVGSAAVTAGLYRTYWGKDPNYTGMAEGAGVTYWDETTEGIEWLSATNGIAYCAENTFDVANQMDVNTTTAIVKVKFNSGATFYTINNASDSLYAGNVLTDSIKSYFLRNIDIVNAIKDTIQSGKELTAADITVKFSTADTVAGIVMVDSIYISKETGKIKPNAENKDFSAATLMIGVRSALDIVNANNVLRRYVGGIAYYPVHVKHFGDDSTPWTPEGMTQNETPSPKSGDIYPETNRDGNYLGRYGMLRNNWYDIKVTAIKSLGTATVPTLGNTIVPEHPEDDPEGPGNGGYDDDIDEYISVKINILAWAKRTQSVEL